MKPVLVACGVLREARIAERAGNVVAVAGGGDGDWLEERLEALAAEGAAGVMSFGLCGALVPGLHVGDVVIAQAVVGSVNADACVSWTARFHEILNSHPGFEPGPTSSPSATRLAVQGRSRLKAGMTIWANGTLAATMAHKTTLRAATGSAAIDMESHVAARVAARHGLPFAVARVVSDTASDTLPPAFAVAMRRGGGTNVRAMLVSLATHPAQIPAFARASANAMRALKQLELLGRLLGPRLGLPDLG